MFSYFKNIVKSKSATGLEVIIMPDGSYELNLVSLKKQGPSLSTEKQTSGLFTFEEAATLIDASFPLLLIINGKGVIHRKVDIHETDTPAILLSRVLPNANPDEFVIQKTLLGPAHAFISVIRLNTFTEILEKLIQNKLLSLSGCFLGPFVINDLLPLIGSDSINNETITIGNYQLQVREQQVTEITPAGITGSSNIRVGDDNIPQNLLIAFAGALSYFTENNNARLNDKVGQGVLNAVRLNELKEEFRQKQKFIIRGWSALAAVFIVLMANFFIFNNYWSKNQEINSRLLSTQSALQRYEKLKMEFGQKKYFLEQNGLLDHSRTSYYADQLAKDLPASIQWTVVNIHPLKKKKASDESETLSFENKTIRISGNCQRSTDLNDWMKKMKKQSWVSDVTMVDYKQENARENGIYLIEVKIK